MARIGLVIKPGIEQALQLAEQVIAWAEKNKSELILEAISAKALAKRAKGKHFTEMSADELARSADPIITLGGDGTLIGIARHVQEKSPVMIGVNFGHLGFLTEISPDELIKVLEKVLHNGSKYAERSMLLAEVFRGGKSVFRSQLVNDAVVQKGVKDKLLSLDLAVNGEAVVRVRADGMIVATPTGSTAYSLSAGGSIAHPMLGVMLVTPICAHSLTNRPLILDINTKLSITVPAYDGEVFLIIDGQESFAVQVGDKLEITQAKNKVHFVQSPTKSYFEILRTKLNWGIGNKPE